MMLVWFLRLCVYIDVLYRCYFFNCICLGCFLLVFVLYKIELYLGYYYCCNRGKEEEGRKRELGKI